MIRDSIVEEVRAARDAIAREHGYEVDAIFASLRELEARAGRPAVSLPPRRVVPSHNSDQTTPARGSAQSRPSGAGQVVPATSALRYGG